MNDFDKHLVCIGAGYVGGPSMAMIAAVSPSTKVTVVDLNIDRINAWASGEPPIYEPGLKELLGISLNRNLFFTTDGVSAVATADMVFMCVNTPTKAFGRGAGYASDISYLEKAARMIRDAATKELVVVEKSTVPVKTAEVISAIFATGRFKHQVLSNPEFLAVGAAVKDLASPDRVLIGGGSDEAGQAAIQALVDVYAKWVPRANILTTSVWSSELSKLVANALLAQRISSINSISALCERTGADIREISKAVGMDGRIGNRFLQASVGFGGSCFKKDILNLVYICRSFGLEEVGDYWESVVDINDWQQIRFVKRLTQALHGTLNGKRIAVLGLAFKADTGDVRESAAIQVVKELLEERAHVVVYDPQAMSNFAIELGAGLASRIEFVGSAMAAADGAHAVCVLTEWACFKDLNFEMMYDGMEKPTWLFDGRNILDHGVLKEIGFNVAAIGVMG